MLAALGAAFVAGVWLVQQLAALPGARVLVLLASATAGLAVLAMRRAAARAPAPDRQAVDRRGPWLPRAAALAAVTGAGFLVASGWAHLRMADALDPALEGRDLRVVGVVQELPASLLRGQRFEFTVESARALDGAPIAVPSRISLAWYEPAASVRPGERWAFTVRLRRPHGLMNPGGFDLEAWLLERGLRATGSVRGGPRAPAPERLDAMVWRAGTAIDRGRDVLRERLRASLGEARYAGVVIALVLGDQRAIAAEDWRLFQQTGITHLVSISGLHITMIAALVAGLVGAAWRRVPALLARAPAQSAAAAAATLAAFLYCLLAGWGVPAQRTFFMLATVAVALLARWPIGPAATLALAAVVVSALDPWAVIAPGFWLSFGAVAAIFWIAAHRPAIGAEGWRRILREATRVQAAVTIALVPLTVALFQQVSLVSPLANAIAIPVVSFLVTPLALVGAALVAIPLGAGVGAMLLAMAHALFELLAQALSALSAAGGGLAVAFLPAPPGWTVALAVLGAAWLLAPRGWPLRALGAVWMLPLLLWPASRPGVGEFWVTALDVGQGMAVLVESRAAVLLYDTGARYTPQADAGSRVIVPALRWRGIDRLDALVVSHLDSDHSGGAASVLRALPVRRVLSSIDAAHPALADAPLVERCVEGMGFEIGAGDDALRVQVLHPSADRYTLRTSTNAMSCVVRIEHRGRIVLLPGDIPAREEAALVAALGHDALRADLLAAPHHGSRTSSSAVLLAAVAPRWVVVQAGYRNRFGHPDPVVIARYAQAGASVRRTDEDGALRWRFAPDGSVRVEAMRHAAARYWHNRPGRVAIAAIEEDAPVDESGVVLDEVAREEILAPMP